MNNLLTVLQDNLGATYSPINEIPDCVCVNSTRHVINFDAVKENFCTAIGTASRIKSTDCLYINLESKTIYFIEVKDAASHIARLWSIPPDDNESAFVSDFESWIQGLRDDLRAKVAESIFIITSSLALYSPDPNDVADLLDRAAVRIKYFVVFHLTDKNLITYNLSSLQSLTSNRHSICYGLLAGKQGLATVFTANEFDTYAAAFF